MPTSPDVGLRVNGTVYTGWEAVTVTSSLESFPDLFDMSAPDLKASRSIPQGATCEVLSRGRVVLTGQIEQASYGEGMGGHLCRVSGRSLPYHLLKSCARPGNYSGMTPTDIALLFGAEWGLGVTAGPGTVVKPVRRMWVKAGERGMEHLQRLADSTAHIWTCTPAGGLQWSRPGAESTDTVIGLPNSDTLTMDVDTSEVYETIKVRGQMSTSDLTYGADAQSEAEADGGYRNGDVLILRNGMPVDAGTCMDRAVWEAATRLGKSLVVQASMPSWHMANGEPWRAGILATVRSEWLGLNTRMVVSGVVFSFGAESGTACHLTARLPESYLPQPVKAAVGKSQRKPGRVTRVEGDLPV